MRTVYFDARWGGAHGIGRYSGEIRRRLTEVVVGDLSCRADPVSIRGIGAWEAVAGAKLARSPRAVLLSPAFAPLVSARARQALTVHDLIHLDVATESSRAKTLYYNAVVRPVVRRSPVTFTVSEYSKNRLLEWAEIDEDRVVVTGNAAAPSFQRSGERYRPGYRYILCVSNKKPHKNLASLVREFAKSQNSDAHLALVGSPDAALAAIVEDCRVADRVHWLGFVEESRLPALYRGAEVFVLPSLYEGFGIPALEAMACGIPVIAGDHTSLPEVVGDSGRLVDASQDGAIADAIDCVLGDEALRSRMSEDGLRRAAGFSWGVVAERVEDALRSRF